MSSIKMPNFPFVRKQASPFKNIILLGLGCTEKALRGSSRGAGPKQKSFDQNPPGVDFSYIVKIERTNPWGPRSIFLKKVNCPV